MSDRRELVEQLLREVHFWAQTNDEFARCYSYLHAASLAIDRPFIGTVSGIVTEVLDGQAITDIGEHEFARLAADRLYSLAKVRA